MFATEVNAENVVVNELRSSNNSIFSHSKLSDIGTNTHTQIDAHIDSITLVHGSTSDNVAGRIVARDSSGNFSAGTIKAQLGDLAEKYTATVPSEVGTVYSVSSNTTAEVEICLEKDSLKVVGVVSDTAGFVLSSEQEGITLGIKGKVKVRVIGPVKKGDLLASAGKGQAYVTTDPHFKFAVALEDNSNVTEKLVLAVL